MNSFCSQIADEMQSLKDQGAQIFDATIDSVRAGHWELGAYTADPLRRTFDISNLAKLSEFASREAYPKYWERVDSLGEWQSGDDSFEKNCEILAALLSQIFAHN